MLFSEYVISLSIDVCSAFKSSVMTFLRSYIGTNVQPAPIAST